MFSGIVETTGKIIELYEQQGCLHITFIPSQTFSDIALGDSISINGVCLTITEITANALKATIVPETLRLTNLSQLKIGNAINLERAIKANQRISGHYVQGHIDDQGKILTLTPDQSAAWLVVIQFSPQLAKYIVKKGFIAIDGMSLTIVDVTQNTFTVTLIPYTQQHTIAQYYQPGTRVNIEVDILSKYIEKLIGAYRD